MKTTTEVPPKADPRGVREIVLDIERMIAAPQATDRDIPVEARRGGYKRHIPTRLSKEAEEAIDIVLADALAKKEQITFDVLIRTCLQVAPRCGLYIGGSMNESIRGYLAERAGIRVMWSKRSTAPSRGW